MTIIAFFSFSKRREEQANQTGKISRQTISLYKSCSRVKLTIKIDENNWGIV